MTNDPAHWKVQQWRDHVAGLEIGKLRAFEEYVAIFGVVMTPNEIILRDALNALAIAYVGLLATGRERIIDLGGECDPMNVMMAGDPALAAAHTALSIVEGLG